MPFAPIANPDLAAQLMYQGISQAGSGIASGLSKALEGMKAKSKERKTYLGMANAMNQQGLIDDHGLAALQNADTDTVKGNIDGVITGSTLKHIKQQNEQLAANMQVAAQDRAKFQGLNEDLATAMSPPGAGEEGPTGQLTPEILAAASAKRGLIGNPGLDKFISAMDRTEERRQAARVGLEKAPVDITDLGNGTQGANLRGSKDLKILAPQGDANANTMTDDQGNIIGYRVPLGNGRYTYAPARSGPNPAIQQNADINAVTEAEKNLFNLDRSIGAWHGQAAENKRDPKNNPAPNPEHLTDLMERRALQSQIVRRAGTALGSPGVRPATGTAAPPAPSGKRVSVVSPTGQRGTLPAEQLEEALRKGFKQVE